MLQGVQGHPDGERESRTVSYYVPRRPISSRWRERERDCKLLCSKASRVITMERETHTHRKSTTVCDQRRPDGERKSRTVSYYAPMRPTSSRWREKEQDCKLLCSKASRVIPMEREEQDYKLPCSKAFNVIPREREQDCRLPCSMASRVIPME